MPTLPAVIVSLLLPFERLFDPRTWRKARLLAVGAILSPGKRTVSSALNILGVGQHGDFAIYHQALNRARWSSLQLSRVLLLLVVGRLGSSDGPLVFGIDETLERRWGRKIAAKGRYRDPVRSTDDQTVMTPGLQWVSLMLLTHIGGVGRHWALPLMTALAPSARYDRRKGRRRQMVTDYARQMLTCLRRWLPEQDLVLVCDGGYAKREFLRYFQNMSKPIVVVAKLRKDAARYQPAPPRRPGQIGRPRVVGARLPNPRAVLDDPATQWTTYLATGSDGGTTTVELASGLAVWYHAGPPPLAMRWVVVKDSGEHLKPGALLGTDTAAEPRHLLQWYLLRSQVEVTFAEARAHLGMETQRQWSELASARTTPALLGLFSVVTLMADVLIGQQQIEMTPRTTAWYEKTSPSFADAIAMVRRCIWVRHGTFATSEREPELIKVPSSLYHLMLDSLAYAA